jgi:hypothetical protein
MGELEIEPEETQLPTIASDAHGAGFDQLRRCRDNVDSLVAVHASVDVCRVTLPPVARHDRGDLVVIRNDGEIDVVCLALQAHVMVMKRLRLAFSCRERSTGAP